MRRQYISAWYFLAHAIAGIITITEKAEATWVWIKYLLKEKRHG